MTSTGSRSQTPKLCPKCGAFYQDLASKTCPQCFAKLETLTEVEAAELIRQQELRSQDPEYIRRKQADDETFREQSFGACMGVGLAMTAIIVLSVAAVVVALHRPNPTAPGVPTLPADFNTIVPLVLNGERRVAADADITYPSSTVAVYHGTYADGEQVYATALSGVTDRRRDALRFGASLVAQQQTPPAVMVTVEMPRAEYVLLGRTTNEVKAAAGSLLR